MRGPSNWEEAGAPRDPQRLPRFCQPATGCRAGQQCAGSVLPELAETIRRKCHIALRADNGLMPEIGLDRPRILAVIGKLVAGRVPQHVAMDQEAELGGSPGPGDHALIASDAQRRAALADEHIRGRGNALPLEPPQCPDFLAANRMDAGFPTFGTAYMQSAMGQVEIIPP